MTADRARWSLFPHFVVRTTGFPWELLDGLCCPRAAAHARDWVRGMEALDALRTSAPRIKHPSRQVLAALRGNRPVPLDHVDAPERFTEWNARAAEVQAALAGMEQALAEELPASVAALRKLPEDPRWLEAIASSSPPVFTDLARGRWSGRLERQLASYAQRFSAKNETMGFFGPINYGRCEPDAPDGVALSWSGPAHLTARRTHAASWLVRGLVPRLAFDPALAPWLVLRRKGFAHPPLALPPRKLGEILVERGSITATQLERRLADQPRRARRLGELLIEDRLCTPTEIEEALALQHAAAKGRGASLGSEAVLLEKLVRVADGVHPLGLLCGRLGVPLETAIGIARLACDRGLLTHPLEVPSSSQQPLLDLAERLSAFPGTAATAHLAALSELIGMMERYSAADARGKVALNDQLRRRAEERWGILSPGSADATAAPKPTAATPSPGGASAPLTVPRAQTGTVTTVAQRSAYATPPPDGRTGSMGVSQHSAYLTPPPDAPRASAASTSASGSSPHTPHAQVGSTSTAGAPQLGGSRAQVTNTNAAGAPRLTPSPDVMTGAHVQGAVATSAANAPPAENGTAGASRLTPSPNVLAGAHAPGAVATSAANAPSAEVGTAGAPRLTPSPDMPAGAHAQGATATSAVNASSDAPRGQAARTSAAGAPAASAATGVASQQPASKADPAGASPPGARAPPPAAPPRENHFYTDRLPLREECGGDLRLQLGGARARELSERLAAPLELLARTAERSRDRARAQLATRLGKRTIPLWKLIAGLPEAPIPFDDWLTKEVTRQITDPSVAEHKLDGVPLDGPAPRSAGLPRVCSVDLLIGAPSVEAWSAGDYRVVMGDIHDAALVWGWALQFHEERAQVENAIARAIGGLSRDVPLVTVLASRRTGLIPAELPGPVVELGGVSSRASAWRLPFDDLLVVSDGETARLRSVALGTEVCLHNGELETLVHTAFALPRIRPPRVETGAHTPRLTLGGIVLQREQWRLSTEHVDALLACKHDGERLREAAKLWSALKLPRHVFAKLPDERKPVLLDPESPTVLRSFQNLLEHRRGAVLSEMLPAPGDFWLSSGGTHHTAELRCVFLSEGSR